MNVQRFTYFYWVLGLCICMVPLISVETPPLIDYPVHLARQFILVNFNQMPALQANYAIDWGIKPNLGIDIVVPWLTTWMPVMVATKVFVAITLLLLVAGTCALTFALHGQVSLIALSCLLFLYNFNLAGGYLNSLAAMGLMMLGVAVWIKTASLNPFIRFAIVSAMTIIIFFTHIFGLAVFVITTGVYEISRFDKKKFTSRPDLFVLLTALIPVLILWLLKRPGPPVSNLDFGSMIHRFTIWLIPGLTFNYSDIFIILVMIFGIFFSFISAKGIPIVQAMRLPVLVLVILALLMPHAIAGGGLVQVRLPALLSFLFIAALPPQLLPSRWITVYLLIVFSVLGVRIADITHAWKSMDTDFQEFSAATQVIEPGAKIIALDGIESSIKRIFYSHVTDLAILERCVFVPHMSKIPDQQPVIASVNTVHLDGGTAVPMDAEQLEQGADPEISARLLTHTFPGWIRPYYANWPKNFDYLIHIHDKEIKNNPRPELLDPVKTGTFFTIYHIRERPKPADLKCKTRS